MATEVRVRRHLDSDTVHIPELKQLIGKDVEITISEVEEPKPRRPLEGSVLRYDDPFGPAEEWDADQ